MIAKTEACGTIQGFQEDYVRSRRTLFLLACFALVCCSVLGAEQQSLWPEVEGMTGPPHLGILFNTNDLLLDIQGFQGGVGAKLSMERWMLRGMTDIVLNTGLDPFSITLGVVLERHLWPGPISVYWGPMVESGFTTILLYKTDEDNWARTNTLPLSMGCVFGIELFIFEFLSVFAEYQAALELGFNNTRTSTAGSISSAKEFTYLFDIGMGNNAMFGIVFYLMGRSDSGIPSQRNRNSTSRNR
jgi:hypothetical protein